MDTLFARGKSITFTTSASFFGALAPAVGPYSLLCEEQVVVMDPVHARDQCTRFNYLHLRRLAQEVLTLAYAAATLYVCLLCLSLIDEKMQLECKTSSMTCMLRRCAYTV